MSRPPAFAAQTGRSGSAAPNPPGLTVNLAQALAQEGNCFHFSLATEDRSKRKQAIERMRIVCGGIVVGDPMVAHKRRLGVRASRWLAHSCFKVPIRFCTTYSHLLRRYASKIMQQSEDQCRGDSVNRPPTQARICGRHTVSPLHIDLMVKFSSTAVMGAGFHFEANDLICAKQ